MKKMNKKVNNRFFPDGKKATKMLMDNVIDLMIIIVFFVAMFLFVARAGAQVTIAEQTYAKQIALLIDNAKPGTIIDLDISELKTISEKNKKDLDKTIIIDNKAGKVRVALTSKGGYEFGFFNSADILWSINSTNLHMEVINNEK